MRHRLPFHLRQFSVGERAGRSIERLPHKRDAKICWCEMTSITHRDFDLAEGLKNGGVVIAPQERSKDFLGDQGMQQLARQKVRSTVGVQVSSRCQPAT